MPGECQFSAQLIMNPKPTSSCSPQTWLLRNSCYNLKLNLETGR